MFVRFFAVFLWTCSIGHAVDAQKRLSAGVYAGGNMTKLDPIKLSQSSVPFSPSYQWTPSYNFGAYVDFNIAKRLYFESGINFISRKSDAKTPRTGSRALFIYNDGVNYTQYFRHYNALVHHSSTGLQIPLSLHLVFLDKKDLKMNVYAGLFLEQILSYSVVGEDVYDWEPNDNPPQKVIDEAALVEAKNSRANWYNSKEYPFAKSILGSIFGIGLNYGRVGIDVGMNNPIMVYSGTQFKNQGFVANLRFRVY